MNYKIQRAIKYIEKNLHRVIKLEDLAGQSAYSKFHYLRVFQSQVGESVAEYIRKRRMIKAAELLISTDKKIIDIALETGYEYQQSFNRAFKNMYGCVPGDAHHNKRKILLINKLSEQLNLSRLKEMRLPFLKNPNITVKEEFKVIGLEFKTTLKALESGQFEEIWAEFNKRLPEVRNVIESDAVYAIWFYNESLNEFTYEPCIEVNSFDFVPDGMIGYVIPKSKYLSFDFPGTDELRKAMTYIVSKWFTEDGYNFSNNIDIVIQIKKGTDPIDANVLIPIKERSMAMLN